MTTTTRPDGTGANNADVGDDPDDVGARGLAITLLLRRGAVYLPADGIAPVAENPAPVPGSHAPAPESPAAVPESHEGVALLEADLLERGFLLSAPLRQAFAARTAGALAAAGRALLTDIDGALGSDRDHTPLFRRFPDSTPRDTRGYFVNRVLTLLFQHPHQPCVLCGAVDTVHAVSPCAHLVCRNCFDGSDFSACPVCHRTLRTDDPFLRPSRPRLTFRRRQALPERVRVLSYGGGLAARTEAAGEELRGLLARTAALSPQETSDLAVLLGTRTRTELDWLPATLPGRETKARVLAWLLHAPETRAAVLPAVTARLDTATDILRLLAVLSGGEPLLAGMPRIAPVPRPVRRALLAALDALDPARAIADMRRYRRLWIRAAHALHPFEHAARHPRAALAVAALRGTELSDDRLGATLRTAAETTADVEVTTGPGTAAGNATTGGDATTGAMTGGDATGAAGTVSASGAAENTSRSVDPSGAKVTLNSWGRRVEIALADRDIPAATALLSQRPGELLRRLDHLLRLAGPDGGGLVVDALAAALPRVSPAVLLSTLGAVRSRRGPGDLLRVFFPKGGGARVYVSEDTRAPLPAGPAEDAVRALTAEVVRRAAALGPVGLAVVDAGLNGVIAPFTERTASRALVTLPRGSELPLPDTHSGADTDVSLDTHSGPDTDVSLDTDIGPGTDIGPDTDISGNGTAGTGKTLRLFLHWMESDTSGRTDLDLSLALFDARWEHIGTCDYTELRFAGTGAVHSGDLTSAPPPRGASEFIDLDLARLEEAGARYAVALCLSYNNVPFAELGDAFAGFMVRDEPPGHGEIFDPRTVEQRFDLTGTSRACVPLLLDIPGRTMRWLDVVQGVSGTHHAVRRYVDEIALLGRSLNDLFASGARVGLGELAVWQAAGRARTVVVRHTDGSASTYRRHEGEDAPAFAARIGTPDQGPVDDLDPDLDPSPDPGPDLDPDPGLDRGLDLTGAGLAFLVRGDIALTGGSQVYALHPAGLNAGAVHLLTATDVVNALAVP
ncbi:RING finger family 4 domain-containing protein [Streptomyces sp. NPDC088341]|uniref:RING finger family 4 domain-containing protein n=1 Tax=Streptomyces sp. NPDC088341 TaxID=3154870 RepID=UPI003436CE0A